MASAKPSTLGAGLIAKGAILPSTNATETANAASTAAKYVGTYHKALTVKLDRARYLALKTAGLELDLNSQEIMVAGLDLWLAQHKQK